MRTDKTIVEGRENEVPLLVRHAGAFPQGSSLGTETFTKASGENQDEDVDMEMRQESSTQSWLVSMGASYDVGQGIWLKGGLPFVHDVHSELGTNTYTNVRVEEVDEDRG